MTESWTLHGESLVAQVERLKAENSALMSAWDAMTGDWEKNSKRVGELLAEVERLKGELGELHSRNQGLKERNREVSRYRDEGFAEVQRLRDQLTDPYDWKSEVERLKGELEHQCTVSAKLSGTLLNTKAEVERLKASEIVRDACGSRPDLMSGKDYVDEVRGHLPPSLEGRENYVHVHDDRFCDKCGQELPKLTTNVPLCACPEWVHGVPQPKPSLEDRAEEIVEILRKYSHWYQGFDYSSGNKEGSQYVDESQWAKVASDIMALMDKGSGYGLRADCGNCGGTIVLYRAWNPDGTPHNCSENEVGRE